MAEALMSGYTAYTSPQAIRADSINAAGGSDDDLITISVTVSLSVTYSWGWTWSH